ncbi:MAG: hypothetical protein ACLFV8_12305 [Alphaproteobacteria bacterium]
MSVELMKTILFWEVVGGLSLAILGSAIWTAIRTPLPERRKGKV